jgi:hypothetical protein
VANMEMDGIVRASDSADDRLVFRIVFRDGTGTTEQQVTLLAREPLSGQRGRLPPAGQVGSFWVGWCGTLSSRLWPQPRQCWMT